MLAEILSSGTYGSYTVAAGYHCLRLTFPAYFTGDIDVEVRLEGSGLTFTGSAAMPSQGNVTSLSDIYAAADGGTCCYMITTLKSPLFE